MLELLEGKKTYLVLIALTALELLGDSAGLDPEMKKDLSYALIALGGASLKDAFDRAFKTGLHKE